MRIHAISQDGLNYLVAHLLAIEAETTGNIDGGSAEVTRDSVRRRSLGTRIHDTSNKQQRSVFLTHPLWTDVPDPGIPYPCPHNFSNQLLKIIFQAKNKNRLKKTPLGNNSNPKQKTLPRPLQSATSPQPRPPTEKGKDPTTDATAHLIPTRTPSYRETGAKKPPKRGANHLIKGETRCTK